MRVRGVEKTHAYALARVEIQLSCGMAPGLHACLTPLAGAGFRRTPACISY